MRNHWQGDEKQPSMHNIDSHLYFLQEMILILKLFFMTCFNRYLLQPLSDSIT